MLLCSNLAHFSEIQLVCDGPTDGQTDGWTDGMTDRHPLIEMRECILKVENSNGVVLVIIVYLLQ